MSSLRALLLVGEDPFKPIAAMWLRCRKEEVSKEQRNQAKQLTYAVLYGLGPFALAQKLNTDPATASQLSRSFLKSMPGLEGWMKRVVEDCRSNGYVTMLSGRRRYLPDIHSENPALQSAAVLPSVHASPSFSFIILVCERSVREWNVCELNGCGCNVYKCMSEIETSVIGFLVNGVPVCVNG
ncbi:hypothetical protein DUNSADRAFT_17615 [Dunaliella salina]|uniref:DNA-directed DNA polymerase n=1 Tax=Dunaliella salina TaxID=3046 RepID=A0ABQ7G1G7_DUNSA|nr:hypothetical protein DUNSADRAFT_17615 [Dunaliella salina]|eukprot:KAF5828436.1 hypothetical protein DUNSADRAFT_17615 [Dunaliella salina]